MAMKVGVGWWQRDGGRRHGDAHANPGSKRSAASYDSWRALVADNPAEEPSDGCADDTDSRAKTGPLGRVASVIPTFVPL